MSVAIKGIDPEPFNKKEIILAVLGTCLLFPALFLKGPLGTLFAMIGLLSLYLLCCNAFVLFVDPHGGTRWDKEQGRKIFFYFFFALVVVLIVMVLVCAIM